MVRTDDEQPEVAELHHIVPKCLGGTDDKSNLVRLSLREHFIAHLLLFKSYQHKTKRLKGALGKLACAVVFMTNTRDKRKGCQIVNSRMYEQMRLEKRKYISEVVSKLQTGKKNSNFGNVWIKNPLTRESRLIDACERLPEGWVKGRYTSQSVEHEKKIKNLENERSEKKLKRLKKYASLLLARKVQMLFGWNEVKRRFGFSFSKANFTQQLRRVRSCIDEVLPFVDEITREEAIALCESKQGKRKA